MIHSPIKKINYKDYFERKRQSYIDYYLKTAKSFSETSIQELNIEFLNLENAFFMLIYEGDIKKVYEFWDVMHEYFWQHGYWRKYSEWADLILKGMHLLEEEDARRANLTRQLGWITMEAGDYKNAENLFHSARKLFILQNDNKGLCLIEQYLSVSAYRKNDIQLALEQCEIAESLALRIDYIDALPAIYNLRGNIEKKFENFELSKFFFNKALNLSEVLSDDWGKIVPLHNLAKLTIYMGDLEKAKNDLDQVIKLCKELDRKDMLYASQLQLADVEFRLGNLYVAKDLALMARDGFVSLGLMKSIEKTDHLLAIIKNTFYDD